MQITAELVCFFIFAVPLVITALGVVIARSPVYAAMNLVAAFFFMAGIYVLLAAHLIAFMQILVYAGAVMVLFLFVIMLLSTGEEHLEP
jgi:NADH-quinone oxidoreductase subunit J